VTPACAYDPVRQITSAADDQGDRGWRRLLPHKVLPTEPGELAWSLGKTGGRNVAANARPETLDARLPSCRIVVRCRYGAGWLAALILSMLNRNPTSPAVRPFTSCIRPS
jgi:hypothetical protein